MVAYPSHHSYTISNCLSILGYSELVNPRNTLWLRHFCTTDHLITFVYSYSLAWMLCMRDRRWNRRWCKDSCFWQTWSQYWVPKDLSGCWWRRPRSAMNPSSLPSYTPVSLITPTRHQQRYCLPCHWQHIYVIALLNLQSVTPNVEEGSLL